MAAIIYGPHYSTYVRSVRLVFEEKGAPYELVEVDIFKGEHKVPEHLQRHPFGTVPAFSHDGFDLYESDAIMRYADRVLPGVRLTPEDPKTEARMNQIMGIVDAYAYSAMISNVVIQRVIAPMMGGTSDEAVIAAAMPKAHTALGEFERLMGNGKFLAGSALSLADLLLAPVMAYFSATPEGTSALPGHPNLERWWKAMAERPSMQKTQPKLG